ncbi:hypothetical protein Tco_0822987 [Tanacetum coccineum]|uniref:Uncharacterized protein n=1 Tax=Tanacetum coccineum TaxID=301880 RepID=A0ABQ5AKZ2_9ASTR
MYLRVRCLSNQPVLLMVWKIGLRAYSSHETRSSQKVEATPKRIKKEFQKEDALRRKFIHPQVKLLLSSVRRYDNNHAATVKKHDASKKHVKTRDHRLISDSFLVKFPEFLFTYVSRWLASSYDWATNSLTDGVSEGKPIAQILVVQLSTATDKSKASARKLESDVV